MPKIGTVTEEPSRNYWKSNTGTRHEHDSKGLAGPPALARKGHETHSKSSNTITPGKNQVLSLGTGCTNCWKLETRHRWSNLLCRRGKALWWHAPAEWELENEWHWASGSEADGGWKISTVKMKPGAPSAKNELEAPKRNSLEATETWTPLAQWGHNSVGVKSTRATKEEHTRKILLKHNLPTRNTEEISSTIKLNRADLAQ
jgi:hypothetical protein